MQSLDGCRKICITAALARDRHVLVFDLVFASNPLQYSIVRVVTSTVKSDHKAVVLYAESHPAPCVKSVSKNTFRNITPNQHALFLEHISEITYHIPAVSSDTVQSLSGLCPSDPGRYACSV